MPKRFSAQTIIDAFKITGLNPERGHIQPYDGRCCALGALAVQYGIAGTSRQLYDWADEKYGRENSKAIRHGFDGFVQSPHIRSPYYKSARKAAKMLGLK